MRLVLRAATVLCLTALVLVPASSAAASPPGSVVALDPGITCQTSQEHFSDDGLWAAYIGYQCPGAPSPWTAFQLDLTSGAVTAVSPAGTTASTVDVDDEGDVVWGGSNQQGNVLKLWHAADATTSDVATSVRTGGSDPFVPGYGPWLSSDGHYVGFSTVSRLVDADQYADTSDVYVRDVWDAQVSYDWVQITGDGTPYDMSADGRHIAFLTGSGLDPVDTNASYDVYEADIGVGSVTYALVGRPGGGLSPDGTFGRGSGMLSADGNRVLFLLSSGLAAQVYDRTTGETFTTGVDTTGAWTNTYPLLLDATGTQVVFQTNGFGPYDPVNGYAGWHLSDGTVLTVCDAKNQTVVQDLATGTLGLASVNTTGGPASGGPGGVSDCNGTSQPMAVSAGGQRVAMKSNRLDLVSPALTPAAVPPSGYLYAYDRERPALPVALSLPSVSGAVVGSDASCDPGTWYPAAVTDLSYAWRVNGVVVPGENASSYRVQVADGGKQLVCDVTGTDTTGSSTASSPAAAVPAVSAPVAGTVTITGSATLGGTLTCNPGTWGGSPAPDLFYDWTRAGTSGSVATTAQYVLTTADATHAVRCAVTGVNVVSSVSRTSTNSVTLPAAPALKKAPALTASPSPPRAGSTLTCSTGSWTGASTYQYSFARNGLTVQALSSTSTHVLTSADLGTSWTCTVRAANAGGTTDATSAALAVPPLPSNVTAPLLSWKNPLRAGTKLSTTTGTWTPTTPALTYSYQWTRDGVVIPAATTSTYSVVAADVGHSIRSQVRATSTSGTSGWVSSSNAATP